jgi:predicted AAA+ superfamily ATPase
MVKTRSSYLHHIQEAFEVVPICAILGPRQCGKTTLARQYVPLHPGPVHYFDLEDPSDLSKLDNPKLTLEPLQGLIVIDEIQRRPDLFPYLRVLVDQKDIHLLILGSASRDLLQQSSETLAGRILYLELSPFSLLEVEDWKTLWVRGGFPRSFLSKTDRTSCRWRHAYIQTYFERDLAMMGILLTPHDMGKMWNFLIQFHGATLNYADIARFLHLSVPTLKKYLGILEGTFMIRTLAPWFENMSKRQVKSPKLYLRDSGIYHQLMGISSYETLILNPHVGASWEGFAMEEMIKILSLRPQECYFWATHQRAELDFLVFYQGKRLGFECKYSDHPKVTPSMRIALEELRLDELFVLSPFEGHYRLHPKITVTSLRTLPTLLGVSSQKEDRG